jgi:hypothetical protein
MIAAGYGEVLALWEGADHPTKSGFGASSATFLYPAACFILFSPESGVQLVRQCLLP